MKEYKKGTVFTYKGFKWKILEFNEEYATVKKIGRENAWSSWPNQNVEDLVTLPIAVLEHYLKGLNYSALCCTSCGSTNVSFPSIPGHEKSQVLMISTMSSWNLAFLKCNDCGECSAYEDEQDLGGFNANASQHFTKAPIEYVPLSAEQIEFARKSKYLILPNTGKYQTGVWISSIECPFDFLVEKCKEKNDESSITYIKEPGFIEKIKAVLPDQYGVKENHVMVTF